ncbi:MAG TPA: DUF4082 domain-containing protein, partial [Longimicrobium sp.]|nr:DUF4082 domain-containing protein [Longimicrobium sp.]
FTTQAPASTVEPGWDGMQVGTEFTLSDSVTVTGFRYYKASGEAGSHTARLYRSSGTQVASKSFSGGTSSGWQRVSVTPFPLAPGTYVVTVNTNLYQAKTGAYFDDDGPIYREGLEATGGRYGYPTGQFPSYSTSDAFFVDLVYVP